MLKSPRKTDKILSSLYAVFLISHRERSHSLDQRRPVNNKPHLNLQAHPLAAHSQQIPSIRKFHHSPGKVVAARCDMLRLTLPHRINARHLPSPQKITLLVEEYFNNVHPLRCYAFIHRPTFLQKLDKRSPNQHQDNALLHIICALGAQ